MIELRSFANQCSYHEQNGKYYIVADHKEILCEVTKEQIEMPDYDLLEKEFNKYLKRKWPSFWKNPLKWIGLIKS